MNAPDGYLQTDELPTEPDSDVSFEETDDSFSKENEPKQRKEAVEVDESLCVTG